MTMPVLLRALIALELLFWTNIGHGMLGHAWPDAFGFALAAVLAVRALQQAFIWGFSRAHASSAPPLGAWAWLKMLGAEFAAYLACFVVLLPLEGLWMRPDRLRPARQVVLLVHGYGCSRGVWWWWRRRLEAAGHIVATVSLNPPWADIDALAGVLAARIREVQAATGAQEVLLIGHSMGGLVSRTYLKQYPHAPVPLLITLATPHQGSALARLGFGHNARQMEPASPFLTSLAGWPLPPHALSLRATHDDFVCPQDGQRLTGMQDVPLTGVGHLALLFSGRALAHACQALAAPHPQERN
ncbi:esterase/lipase family protein [Crenobacter caeni]|uniref:Alpha/beta fold hydrolase n=1 Tax=Crenobacter caeni TaxID=2705474 RepID=A0A6B2KQZ2_9NEIS|nr:alpha/beta fold hydrolase [Crenobacter caeni]NDV12399.1 alpha/beta fold hydrolase [Crenobacter caeni]